ncbi:hypothetical protein ACOMHN_017206 [Nucella lapillus]
MSHVHDGPLATYNSLTDSHLAGYFANGRMRRHLHKAGLVSRRGEIVSESMYRLNMSRREHKRHVKDMLAQAIVHKTLDMERFRQAEIKQKLEEIAKIEIVRRVRASSNRKGDEDILPILTPRSSGQSPSPSPRGRGRRSKQRLGSDVPGVRRRGRRRRQSDASLEEEGDVLYLDDEGRPITPGAMGSDRHHPEQSNLDSRHLHSLDTAAFRKYAQLMTVLEEGRGMASPYMMPQVPLPPRPPSSARTPRSARRVQSASPRRNITTDSRLARLHRPETAKSHAGDQQTLCQVSMRYHGWALHLARERTDHTQEVTIEQQHCGGNTLTVFKERLEPGSKFEFISYRHRGYPFSLSLYVDGQMDSRVSTCCEYRHSRGAKIGGKQGHFSLLRVSGAVPCYKCQVAKGVQVPTRASPRRLKRPAEVRREEVIVVSTKGDRNQEKEDRGERKVSEPVEDFSDDGGDVVMIPVEGDEHDDSEHNESDTKLRNAQTDDYADDFEDSQASKTSKSTDDSSTSSSESESETPKEEDYTLSVRNKERGQEQPQRDVIPTDGDTFPSYRTGAKCKPRPKSVAKGRLSERAEGDRQSPERAPFTNTITPCHSPSSSARSSSSSSVPVVQEEKPKRKKQAKGLKSVKKPDPQPLEAEDADEVKNVQGEEKIGYQEKDRQPTEDKHTESQTPKAASTDRTDEEKTADRNKDPQPAEKKRIENQTPNAASTDRTDPDTALPVKAEETAEELVRHAEPETREPCGAVAEKEPDPTAPSRTENPEDTKQEPREDKATTSSSVMAEAEATKRPELPLEDNHKHPLNKDQQVLQETRNAKTSKEAVTGDEVSEIESEVASPRRPDPNLPIDFVRAPSQHSAADSPRMSFSPRGQGRSTGRHLAGVREEDEDERKMKEEDKEEGLSRGEEDAKNAYNTLNEEPRGREEKEGGNYIILNKHHHGTGKKKGVRKENHSKSHNPLPQSRPRTAKKHSSSSSSSNSSSETSSSTTTTISSTTTTTTTTEDDSYASSSTVSGGSEHYSTVAQKDERAALLNEEQEGDKRYTLSHTKKEKIIKRPKKKQSSGKTDSRTKKESLQHSVDPATQYVEPPPDYDTSRGKEQNESVEETGRNDLPLGMTGVQEEGKSTGDDRGIQEEKVVTGTCESAGLEEPEPGNPHSLQPFPTHLESALHGDDTFDSSEKEEEEPVPVEAMPEIVISPVP